MGKFGETYAKLGVAKQAATACDHDTIIAVDSSPRGGAKVWHTGHWDEFVHDIYHTDMFERWYYEVVHSTPINQPIGYNAGCGASIGQDEGKCGVRFVIDVDFSVNSSQVQSRIDSALEFFEASRNIVNKTQKGAFSDQKKTQYTRELKSVFNALLSPDSWRDAVANLRVAVQDWVREGLIQLGFSEAETKQDILDASCLSEDGELEPSHKLKFSLHLHLNRIILRQHAVDGAILARNLNCVMSGSMLCKFAASETEVNPDFWRKCILLNIPDKSLWQGASCLSRQCIASLGVIDESIYSEGRCIRMWLSSKRGQNRPLTRVDETGRATEQRNVTFDAFSAGIRNFKIAYDRPNTRSIVHGIQLTNQSAFPPLHPTCMRRLNSRRSADGADVTGVHWTEKTLCVSSLVELWDRFASNEAKSRKNSSTPNDTLTSDCTIPQIFRGFSSRRVLYSTMTIYTDAGAPVKAAELEESVHYHCPTCDCEPRNVVVQGDEQSGPPDLNSSATCIVTTDLDLALWCFSCKHLQIVRQILNYGGFDDSDASVKKVEPTNGGRYFPSDVIEPILTRSFSKLGLPSLVAVNAGMGSGKTHGANKLSRLNGVRRVLIVTHRKTLARALAIKFEATCYLDVSDKAALASYSRLVIVVNSIWRIIGAKDYDLVVVDEAGFVRRHFAGQTFTKLGDASVPHTRKNVVATLSTYCRFAKSIILLQDGLSNEDVQFWCVLRRNNRRVHKYWMPKPVRPEKYKLVDDFYDWLCELHHSAGVVKRKTFVACSLAVDALTLYTFFKTECPSLNVAMICGDHVEPSDVGGAEKFVRHYKNYDICIATSAMETGVSLEGHFTESFALYRPSPIAHPSQIQLVNRVRDAERIVIYATKGTPFSHRQTIKLLKRDWHYKNTIMNPSTVGGHPVHLDVLDDVLCSAFLTKIVEDADAKNNNRDLWKLHQKATLLTQFNYDKAKKVGIARAYFSMAAENGKRFKEELREIRLNSIFDDDNDSLAQNIDIVEALVPSPPSSSMDGHESESPPSVEKARSRYTKKKLNDAQEFMHPSVIRVMQATQRVDARLPKKGNRSREKNETAKAMNDRRFALRASIVLTIIDHYAGLQRAPNEETREKIRKHSFWSVIVSWATTRPPTSDTQTQNELQCVLEVLQALSVVQAMFGTFFPAESTYMVISPDSAKETALALRAWKPPKSISACISHTLSSSRTAYETDLRHAAAGLASGGPKKSLGKKTRAHVLKYVPVSWAKRKREGQDAVVINPWCVPSMALIACGLEHAFFPADIETLSHCQWFFFDRLEDLRHACVNYERPSDPANEESALRDVYKEMHKLRENAYQAQSMRLKLPKELLP